MENTHMETIRLHGVQVPATEYEQLKRLEAVAFLEADPGLPTAAAHRLAVKAAIAALATIRTVTRWQ